MQTECIPTKLSFQPLGRRRVEADFEAGRVTSDAGLLLLRQVAQRMNLFPRLAHCFRDHRSPKRIEHAVEELLAQRVLGLACGYEDLNDHDDLRGDPMFALAVGKERPFGEDRHDPRDRGFALAAHATLNRIESAPSSLNFGRKDLKILHDPAAIEKLLVELFLDSHEKPPRRIIIDVDATDDPIHGTQEGRFYHGYYGGYCYLPLYIFCGDFLLVAKLRTADQDGAAGTLEELQRVVGQIRRRWPAVQILIRGDSGFCRDSLMSWCESQDGVDYLFGLARNKRLQASIASEMASVKKKAERYGRAVRTFRELRYRTLDSWSRSRRVVAKVEALVGKTNPRFVVTSLQIRAATTFELYTDYYCARGDMENRIKEQQLGLFADRTSAHTMRANQLRLWFSALAYILMNELRRVGLAGTELARAQMTTIRLRLLKIGALVTQSVRRVHVSMSSAYPGKAVFTEIHARLASLTEDVAM